MNEFLELMGRVLPLVIGGGIIQGVIFLLKRRSELKVLDTAAAKAQAEADAVVVDSAAKSLELSDRVRDNAIARAEAATVKADALMVELAMQIARNRESTARLSVIEARSLVLEDEVADLKAKITALESGGVS